MIWMQAKWEKWMQALRGARQLKWILLCAAAALVVLSLYPASRAARQQADGTDIEARMERVLSQVSGAGRVRVLVNEKENVTGAFSTGQTGADSIEGVVVVAEGARDVRVSLELLRAVKALLGIEAERIEVLAMEESG